MKKETIYLSLAMLAITNIPCNAQSEEIKDSTITSRRSNYQYHTYA